MATVVFTSIAPDWLKIRRGTRVAGLRRDQAVAGAVWR